MLILVKIFIRYSFFFFIIFFIFIFFLFFFFFCLSVSVNNSIDFDVDPCQDLYQVLFLSLPILSLSFYPLSSLFLSPSPQSSPPQPPKFSCGKWIENTEIPADRSGWYKSFSVIDARNEVVLAKILKDDWPLLGTFYENCDFFFFFFF